MLSAPCETTPVKPEEVDELPVAATKVCLSHSRSRTCTNRECPLFQMSEKSVKEEEPNNMIYVENNNEATQLADLLMEQWSEKELQDGVRCDGCNGKAAAREHTCARSLPSTLLFAFPRALPQQTERWRRNHRPIICPHDMRMLTHDVRAW